MEKWGRCVHEIFVSIYNKVGLLLYAVKCIVEICHMLIQETVNSVSLHNGSYNTTRYISINNNFLLLYRLCLNIFIQKTFTAGTTSLVFHIEYLNITAYWVY